MPWAAAGRLLGIPTSSGSSSRERESRRSSWAPGSTTTTTTTAALSSLFAAPNSGGRSATHSRNKSHNPPNAPSAPVPQEAHLNAPNRSNSTVQLRRSESDLLVGTEPTSASQSSAGGVIKRSLSTRRPVSMMAPSRPQSTAGDLITGPCMCCDLTVKWPAQLNNFRCTVCLTINDLKAPPPSDPTAPKPAPISINKVKEIIDTCLREYLERREEWLKKPEAERLAEEQPPTPAQRRHTTIDPTRDEQNSSPPLRVSPPPQNGQGSNADLRRAATIAQLPSDGPWTRKLQDAKVFKPLEDYIYNCFTNWECLNSSFIAHNGNYAPDSESAVYDNKEEEIIPPRRDSMEIPVTEKPCEKETLMLTVGRVQRRDRTSSRPERSSKSQEARPNLKPPSGIDWDMAKHFYDVVINAGKNVQSGLWESGESHYDENVLEDARLEMLKCLLRSTETILKRPGRPLKRAEDIRFLLVILANPLLYAGGQKVKVSRRSEASSSSAGTDARSPNRNSRASPAVKDSSSGGAFCHSGILKRLFGIISNLPNDCHHYLVTWFTITPEKHFRRLVELGCSFTTYRITRHDNKRPMRNAATGIVGKLPYSDDWQIRATARVMSLLAVANDNVSGRRRHAKGGFLTTTSAFDSSNPASGWKQDAPVYKPGKIVPSSTFYNMRLDYCDLISDFDAWEARVVKFCFCQYPFFLSMGAKIQILEHDARRQMEVQARNAFLTNISNRTSALSQYMVLKVRRECLVEDSLKGISEGAGTLDDLKKGLRIEFTGEEGIDAGGLKKEWFLMLAREVFDPNHGLFIYDEDSAHCYFNPFSFESSEEFYLVGVLLGLAIYNSTILDINLPSYIFRKLIHFAPHTSSIVKGTSASAAQHRPPFRRTLADLASIRPALAVGLQKLLDFEGNVQETFCRDFVAESDRYGEKITVPLCPNGENRPVTNANRKEFVDLYVKHILDTSVSRQFEPFKRGFYTVCGGNALSLFNPEEIELLVRGSAEPLDVAALKAVAVYDGWGRDVEPEQDVVVKWFWGFFEKLVPEKQRLLLSFITGSDRIPAMGATDLIIKVVCLGGDCERFPVARTCFNMVCLWRYKSRERLERLLWRAVTESEGFGLK